MTTVVNVTKERLLSGKVAFGLGVRFSRSVEIARAASAAGYHFLFIDLEHSTMSVDLAGQICVAALDAGVTPIVRVPSHDHFHATRILDGGALGIVVPHVNDAEEARNAVQNCKYPPVGHRSGMGATVQLGWEVLPDEEANRRMNDGVLVVVMLETPTAIENVDAIAAVGGIDVLSVGTTDLANEMGISGQFDHPRIYEAYARVAAAAKRHNLSLRFGGVYDPVLVKKTIELGSRMLMLGNDFGFLMQTMRQKLKDVSSFVDPSLLRN